jgi:hypothetical protein
MEEEESLEEEEERGYFRFKHTAASFERPLVTVGLRFTQYGLERQTYTTRGELTMRPISINGHGPLQS